MSSPSPLTVLIVGNGVAGPILAMALQKTTPHKIILVDAGPEETLPIGAAVGIAPNGLHALRFIGAEQIVVEKGGKFEYMAVRRGDTGKTLAEQVTAEIFTEKYGFAGYGIIRQEYCHALRALAKERNVDMRYNMRLKSIEETDHVVTAQFDSGETLTADLLVGCDGIHSPTRAYVVGQDIKPRFANASVLVGLSKVSNSDGDAMKLARGMNLFLGNNGTCGIFPADPNGTWGWFLGFGTPDPSGGETAWGNDHSIEQLSKLALSKMDGWNASIPPMVIEKTFRCFPIPLYDREPMEQWHKGRVVLVGDAAHPTTPAGGQGSQMAAESAVLLARLLAEHHPSEDLFRRYAQLRHPRTDAVTANSRRAVDNVLVSRSGAWQMIRDTVISLFGGYFLKSGMLGQYEYDVGTAALGI